MNPYKILNIDYHASQREIIQAAALALRERIFSSREVAVAQKELLDPITRAAHTFLHFIDVKPLQERLPLTRLKVWSVPDLKRLSIFDEDS